MPPRRGWIFDEDLSQVLWRQLLRGPRPRSVQWPRRSVSAVDGQPPAPKKGRGKGQAKGVGKGVGRDAAKTKGQAEVQSRRGVPESSPEGHERVLRLQAALEVGKEDLWRDVEELWELPETEEVASSS